MRKSTCRKPVSTTYCLVKILQVPFLKLSLYFFSTKGILNWYCKLADSASNAFYDFFLAGGWLKCSAL
jgi:hypothetical protein